MCAIFITHVRNCVMGAMPLWAFTPYLCHKYWNLVYIFFSRTTAYGASNTVARVGSMIAPQIVFLVSTLKRCYKWPPYIFAPVQKIKITLIKFQFFEKNPGFVKTLQIISFRNDR